MAYTKLAFFVLPQISNLSQNMPQMAAYFQGLLVCGIFMSMGQAGTLVFPFDPQIKCEVFFFTLMPKIEKEI